MRHLVIGLVMALLLSSSALSAGTTVNAYITNFGSASVSVLDTTSNGVTPISVGATTWGVAMDPKGARAYATSWNGSTSGAVYAIDPAATYGPTNPVAKVTVGVKPFGIAVSPDRKHAYVSTSGSGGKAGVLTVINTGIDGTESFSVGMSLVLPTGRGASGVAVGRWPVGSAGDGFRLYVANSTNGTISVIDPGPSGTTLSLVGTVCTGGGLIGVAVSRDGSRLYAADTARGRLLVIDTGQVSCGTEFPFVPVGLSQFSAPFGVAVSWDRALLRDAYVFVANSGDHTVSVVDATSMVVNATIDVGDGIGGVGPHGVDVTSDGAKAYVMNMRNNTVSILEFDRATGKWAGSKDPIADPNFKSPVGFGTFLTPSADFIPVSVDIMPGGNPNTINLRSKSKEATVPVAILTTDDFDATRVNPETVTLGPDDPGRAAAPVKMKPNGTPMAALEDVDGDGRPDLVVHIERDKLQLRASDTEAILLGQTYPDNDNHVDSIRGTDTVKVIQ